MPYRKDKFSMLTPSELYELSLYEELCVVSNKNNVILVRHKETGILHIKKTLELFNLDVYTKLKSINLAGVPKIFGLYNTGDDLIVIEEYFHGSTIDKCFPKPNNINEKLLSSYIIQLCNILDTLHNLTPKIIHRDIKPSNIIISNDGFVKLIDFNASKEFVQGKGKDTVLMGTRGYAAPEQYGFSQSDEKTDMYGVGITIKYLLTGSTLLNDIPNSPLGKIISKATEFSPKDRFPTIYNMKLHLEASLNPYQKEGSNTIYQNSSIKVKKKSHIKKNFSSSLQKVFCPKFSKMQHILFAILYCLCFYSLFFMEYRDENNVLYPEPVQTMYIISCAIVFIGLFLYTYNFFSIRTWLLKDYTNPKKRKRRNALYVFLIILIPLLIFSFVHLPFIS